MGDIFWYLTSELHVQTKVLRPNHPYISHVHKKDLLRFITFRQYSLDFGSLTAYGLCADLPVAQ